jgi:hypothetical protein
MRPSPAQLDRAKRLLASEGFADSSEACAAAAGRVRDKFDAHLAPLLGRAGVQALFARSAKLAQIDLRPVAEVTAGSDDAAVLGAYLRSLEPGVAIQTAAVVFGTFLDLVTTFIGERLTVQVLRSAWPAIEETPPQGDRK